MAKGGLQVAKEERIHGGQTLYGDFDGANGRVVEQVRQGLDGLRRD